MDNERNFLGNQNHSFSIDGPENLTIILTKKLDQKLGPLLGQNSAKSPTKHWAKTSGKALCLRWPQSMNHNLIKHGNRIELYGLLQCTPIYAIHSFEACLCCLATRGNSMQKTSNILARTRYIVYAKGRAMPRFVPYRACRYRYKIIERSL